jgi:3-dehydroquinate synthase
MHTTTLQVADYNLFVGDNIWAEFQDFLTLKNYKQFFFLVDENTKKSCLTRFFNKFPAENAHVIEIQSGEIAKNIDTCQHIWSELMHHSADRRTSVLINLGGGVIGDMGGFCAATFKRGIPFIQMPTTLLSQVDSSIGGKLGIDFGHVKNSVGVFANPQAVFILPAFLETLSEREIRSGFAEIVKHALIADNTSWKQLQKIENLSDVNWQEYLVPSLKIKKSIVEIDPFERGLRKALNFGHTIGHALESMALRTPQPLTHGEAIAIGMVCEAFLSNKNHHLSSGELSEIVVFFKKFYPKYNVQAFDFQDIMHLIYNDKKNETASEINFSFLPTIGNVSINQTASLEAIQESLNFYTKVCS